MKNMRFGKIEQPMKRELDSADDCILVNRGQIYKEINVMKVPETL